MEVAAVGVPDERLGELVAAVVSIKPPFHGQVDEAQLIKQAEKASVHLRLISELLDAHGKHHSVYLDSRCRSSLWCRTSLSVSQHECDGIVQTLTPCSKNVHHLARFSKLIFVRLLRNVGRLERQKEAPQRDCECHCLMYGSSK